MGQVKLFKVCLPLVSLRPFLNTLSQINYNEIIITQMVKPWNISANFLNPGQTFFDNSVFSKTLNILQMTYTAEMT